MMRADYHAAGNGPSSDAAPRIAALVPALDCASTIEDVVTGVRGHVRDVLVIDDGSGDDTGRLAAAAGAEVLRHPLRRGKGCALQSGIDWAVARSFTHVVTVDGDGQHLASELPILLEACRENPTAIVLGERSREGHDISPMKLFGNRFANRWVEIASGRAFEDTQSGFRIYPVTATRALGGYAAHYGFETEVLIRALRSGTPVVCRTVKAYYPPADKRISYYRPWVDTIRIIFIAVGLILRLRR